MLTLKPYIDKLQAFPLMKKKEVRELLIDLYKAGEAKGYKRAKREYLTGK